MAKCHTNDPCVSRLSMMTLSHSPYTNLFLSVFLSYPRSELFLSLVVNWVDCRITLPSIHVVLFSFSIVFHLLAEQYKITAICSCCRSAGCPPLFFRFSYRFVIPFLFHYFALSLFRSFNDWLFLLLWLLLLPTYLIPLWFFVRSSLC